MPVASLTSLIISLFGCSFFWLFFDQAISGFIVQINELVMVGHVPYRVILCVLCLFYAATVIFFYAVGKISTTAQSKLIITGILRVQLSRIIKNLWEYEKFAFN